MNARPRACLAIAACVTLSNCRQRPRDVAVVTVLTAARHASHAYARTGDLALQEPGPHGASLVVANAPDLPGHRPLRGAVVDAAPFRGDVSDPLVWWRSAWMDREGHVHPLVADHVTRTRCAQGEGLRVDGSVDGVVLSTRLCPLGEGVFRSDLQAEHLPTGARAGDEIVPGTSEVLIDGHGRTWEGESSARWVVLAEHGTALVFRGLPCDVRRHSVHIASETFPAPVTRSCDGLQVTQTLRVVQGDALDGIAQAVATDRRVRRLSIDAPEATGGVVEVVDADGSVLAAGTLVTGERLVTLPEDLGVAIRVRDRTGVIAGTVALSDTPGVQIVTVRAPRSALLGVVARDPSGVALPVRVLVHGLDGTADPEFLALSEGAGHTSGRSLYLTQGHGVAALAPGRYRVTVSRGPAWTLVSDIVTLETGGRAELSAVLHEVVAPPGWISADLHLHSAPSPDSRVTLGERVASLACNGVGLAVATDHNRVTDFHDAALSEGLSQWVVTVVGDEITSAGPSLWGHFNAFPLPVPDGVRAPEEIAPAYYGLLPAQLFAAARSAGASIVQVNHPRMPPNIGYFDLTHLQPSTGAADAAFAGGFDAVEAFNGIWLQSPERVREGARDLVALARRGIRVAATGNSDSHRLLYEEAGYPRTWVHLGSVGDTVGRTVAGLRGGTTVASSGPFIELSVVGRGEAAPGGTVRVGEGGTVRVHVRVTAPAWVPVERVEIWVNNEVVHIFPATLPSVDGLRFEGETVVPVAHDALVMAWVEATQPLPDVVPYADARSIAFTTPVGVDVDGDGRVVPPPETSPPR